MKKLFLSAMLLSVVSIAHADVTSDFLSSLRRNGYVEQLSNDSNIISWKRINTEFSLCNQLIDSFDIPRIDEKSIKLLRWAMYSMNNGAMTIKCDGYDHSSTISIIQKQN
jgi:hypothetical protein